MNDVKRGVRKHQGKQQKNDHLSSFFFIRVKKRCKKNKNSFQCELLQYLGVILANLARSTDVLFYIREISFRNNLQDQNTCTG
jgi:hypothetical protein